VLEREIAHFADTVPNDGTKTIPEPVKLCPIDWGGEASKIVIGGISLLVVHSRNFNKIAVWLRVSGSAGTVYG